MGRERVIILFVLVVEQHFLFRVISLWSLKRSFTCTMMILPQWFHFPDSFLKEWRASILFTASSLNREVKWVPNLEEKRERKKKLPSSRMDRMSRYNLMSAKDFQVERAFETYFHRQVSRRIYPFVVVTWKCLKEFPSLCVQINSCSALISHLILSLSPPFHDATFGAHFCPKAEAVYLKVFSGYE